MLDSYWQHKTTIEQEFWDHNDHFDWKREAYTRHIENLTDARCSTFGTLETMLGRLKDRATRDNLAKDFQTHERTFFHNCQLHKRVDESEFPVLHVQKEQLLDQSARRSMQGRWYYDDRMANSSKKAAWSGSQTMARLKALDTSTIKPASGESDFKMVAAAMTLNTLAPVSFTNIQNTWATALLQEGFLFKEKSTNRSYLSMRCHGGAAWGFETERDTFPENPDIYLVVDPKITEKQSLSRVKELVITNLSAPVENLEECCEQYVAIPTRICTYLS